MLRFNGGYYLADIHFEIPGKTMNLVTSAGLNSFCDGDYLSAAEDTVDAINVNKRHPFTAVEQWRWSLS